MNKLRKIAMYLATFTFLLASLLWNNSVNAKNNSRLLTTGGITGFEGTSGGGITPWALIASYGSDEEVQATANIQLLTLGEYRLRSYGVALGLYDAVEFSYQRQDLSVSSNIISKTFSVLTEGQITRANSTNIQQDIIGIKYKVFGDAVFSKSDWHPQLAVGAQYKVNLDFDTSLSLPDGQTPLPDVGVPQVLGATEDSGIDYYVSATKYWLGVANGNNLLVNLTARATRANTFGLLGFESASHDQHKLEWEGTIALATSPNIVMGMEFRTQTNRLRGPGSEKTVKDFFVAWFPNKSWSITGAWVDIGHLPFEPDADAFYISITANL